MNYQFDFQSVLAYWPMFLDGAWTTLQLSFWATLVGFVFGVLCAVARTGGPTWLRKLVGAYGNWTPLQDRGRLFPEDLDASDPWQFKNFRVL